MPISKDASDELDTQVRRWAPVGRVALNDPDAGCVLEVYASNEKGGRRVCGFFTSDTEEPQSEIDASSADLPPMSKEEAASLRDLLDKAVVTPWSELDKRDPELLQVIENTLAGQDGRCLDEEYDVGEVADALYKAIQEWLQKSGQIRR